MQFIDKKSFCFDETTVFPSELRPELLCYAERPVRTSTGTVSYGIRLDARRAGEGVDDWVDSLALTSRAEALELRLEFYNELDTVDDVTVVFENDSGSITFAEAEVVNANFPDGFTFPEAAIQAQGTQIVVGIDDYEGGSNAFVYVDATLDADESIGCGRHQFAVTAYVTPLGFDTLNDSVTFVADVDC
jgi:hypothetical protein